MTEPEKRETGAGPQPGADDAALRGVAKLLWSVVGVVALVAAARWGWDAWDRYQASLAGFEVAPPPGPPSAPSGWNELDMPGYRAACPPGWEVDKDFTGPLQWKCVAMMVDLGQYPPNCNIIIEPRTDTATFQSSENYWTELRDGMEKGLPSFQLLREEETWFQGVKGMRAEFTHTSSGPVTAAFGYYLVGEKNAATITCSSPPDLAEPFRLTLEGLASHIYIKDFEPAAAGETAGEPSGQP